MKPNQPIQSPQNQRFKQAMRLHRSRGRKQQNRIIIFGMRESVRAIDSGVEILEWFVCPERMDESSAANLQEKCESGGGQVFELAPPLFEKLQFGDRSEGVIAIADRPELSLESTTFRESGPILILEGLENPGNVGAILRSADGANAGGVVLVEPQQMCCIPIPFEPVWGQFSLCQSQSVPMNKSKVG